MSFQLLQFPPTGTRVIRLRATPESWSGSSAYPSESSILRSWMEQDNDSEDRTKWGTVSGLALAVVISVGFWTGLALLIERVWK